VSVASLMIMTATSGSYQAHYADGRCEPGVITSYARSVSLDGSTFTQVINGAWATTSPRSPPTSRRNAPTTYD
jgi:hypothetical protein